MKIEAYVVPEICTVQNSHAELQSWTKTIDYTLIICSSCAYLMKKHQTRPLNLPPCPQNNVESVRNENNIDRWGMGEVCSM